MRHEESELQRSCVKWFRYKYSTLKPLLFAVPNGGFRNVREASIMKAEGVVAGVSDLILLLPRQGFHALCIEMKTQKGKQSDNQKEFALAVGAEGYKYVICRSFDEFMEVVTNYIGG